MENKPKVFKTLVHKETGEWGEVQYEDRCYYCEKCNFPVLYATVDNLWDFGGPHNLDLDDYELKEVVVIPREEYERLKSIEKDYIRQGDVNTELIRKK